MGQVTAAVLPIGECEGMGMEGRAGKGRLALSLSPHHSAVNENYTSLILSTIAPWPPEEGYEGTQDYEITQEE